MRKRAVIFCVVMVAACLPVLAQELPSNIEFVENKGQWDPRVIYKGEVNSGSFFLQKDGFRVLLHNPDDLARITGAYHGSTVINGNPNPPAAAGGKKVAAASTKPPDHPEDGGSSGGGAGGDQGAANPSMYLHSHAYNVSFVGASPDVKISADKALPGYSNYLIGNDPSKWSNHCRVFQAVTYQNIYPNIDVRYYTDRGQLKYDIIVHPGGNPDQVVMKYEGADKLSTKKGQLIVSTSVGQVTEMEPATYIFNEKGRESVNCKFLIRDGNTVSFKIASHDPNATLIIDPSLTFCSFTGSRVSNWGFTATPGADGSFYAGGIVFGSSYPWNLGALQPVYGGGRFDVAIMKFSSNGSTAVYSTFLGGGDSEAPHSMVCDGAGNLTVIGRTYSKDFPFLKTEGDGGGADMFVARLNSSGSALTGCLRIGGTGDDCVNMADQSRANSEKADSLIRNYGDDSRSEVVLDGSGNILIAASTQSGGSTGGFPIRGAVFQPTYGGGHQDGVVVKIDPTCDHIIWSSFLGGSASDGAFVLKSDPLNGDIYVGGATTSRNFPGDKSGVLQPGYGGGTSDGFVTIISADGSTQKKMSYFGTNVGDAIYGIEIDKSGMPYIMGTTNGVWAVKNAPYVNAGAKQFVCKLKLDLSDYIYSTTFGSANARLPNISPVAFLVDRCENVYISGWGGWIMSGQSDPYGLSGTTGMPVTGNAIKKLTDNRDFYFIVLQKNVSALLYGTFYGQDDNSRTISEHVDGGTSRYDQNGIIYQAVCANCNGGTAKPFPTTPGVWAPANGTGSSGCNLAAIKISFNFSGVYGGLKASVNGRDNDTAGCIPMDAVFRDTVRLAKSYIWNFGDGGPDTATTSTEVNHLYLNPGTYKVMMVVIDSNSCNVRDTSYRYVIGRTDKAVMDFNYDKLGDCYSLRYGFENKSVAPGTRPFTPSSFVWTFSDANGQVIPDPVPFGDTLFHTFSGPGAYSVRLLLVDTGYCNYPDTVLKTVRVASLAKAQFVTPPTGCAPYLARFANTSLGGTDFIWDFGDGTPTTTDPVPTHLYTTPGNYTITLTVNDPSTCNKTDVTQQRITVSGRPGAAFSFAPSPPAANIPIVFTNNSTDGVSYIWHFGDGDSTVKNNMDTVKHLYTSTDTFNVCLVAVNKYGCTDTVCHPVATLINPLVDVPNAFTPGRFGENAVIKVMGFGITKMIWRIYNRWGKIVYQSNDAYFGWDGTYQGILQPMDVYAYTLEVDFFDGKHVSKKGDITLVR